MSRWGWRAAGWMVWGMLGLWVFWSLSGTLASGLVVVVSIGLAWRDESPEGVRARLRTRVAAWWRANRGGPGPGWVVRDSEQVILYLQGCDERLPGRIVRRTLSWAGLGLACLLGVTALADWQPALGAVAAVVLATGTLVCAEVAAAVPLLLSSTQVVLRPQAARVTRRLGFSVQTQLVEARHLRLQVVEDVDGTMLHVGRGVVVAADVDVGRLRAVVGRLAEDVVHESAADALEARRRLQTLPSTRPPVDAPAVGGEPARQVSTMLRVLVAGCALVLAITLFVTHSHVESIWLVVLAMSGVLGLTLARVRRRAERAPGVFGTRPVATPERLNSGATSPSAAPARSACPRPAARSAAVPS